MLWYLSYQGLQGVPGNLALRWRDMKQHFYGCRYFCGGEWEPVYAPTDIVRLTYMNSIAPHWKGSVRVAFPWFGSHLKTTLFFIYACQQSDYWLYQYMSLKNTSMIVFQELGNHNEECHLQKLVLHKMVSPISNQNWRGWACWLGDVCAWTWQYMSGAVDRIGFAVLWGV